MSLDDLVQRLLRLPTEESGTPVQWTSGPGTLAQITNLAAFSWAFFLEVQLDVPAERLPPGLVWLTDALDDSLGLRLVGQDNYELGSLVPVTEASGALLISCQGSPVREQGVVVGHSGRARYWCWPIPPEGTVSTSMVWPEGGIEEDIGTLPGESLRLGAQRSTPLDGDMRHLRPMG